MKAVINYKVVMGRNVNDLEFKVNIEVINGWTTQGGVLINGQTYVQAMVKYEY